MKTKLGTMFLVAVLALAGVGISYAGFTDEIYLYGEANTATVEWEILDYSGTQIWKVWGGNAPVDEIYWDHAWNNDGFMNEAEVLSETSATNAELVSYAYAQGTPFNDGQSGPADIEDKVFIEIDNMFPCQNFVVDFKVKYTGSIPAKIMDFAINAIDTSGEGAPDFQGLNWLEYLWYIGMEGGESPYDRDDLGIFVYASTCEIDQFPPMPVRQDSTTEAPPCYWVGPGYQLHENDEFYVYIVFHLPQDNVFQGLSGTFDATMIAKQWNEVDRDGNPIEPGIGG